MADPLSPPPIGRNPDTVFLLGFLAVAGLGQLLAGTEPGSVAALAPAWMVTAWALILTVGAAVCMAGALLPDRFTGLLVEAAGRVMFAPTSLGYAIAVIDAAGAAGGIVGALLIALAVSSAWRLAQIRRAVVDLRESLSFLADHPAAPPTPPTAGEDPM